MTKFLLTIPLILLSVFTFLYFPTMGLYLTCISTTIIIWQFLNLNRPIKTFISVLTFCSTWLLLIDRTFEAQGNKITGEIIDYYNQYHFTPSTLNVNKTLRLHSFTPILTKYNYDRNYDSLKFFFCKLSYTDIWGNEFEYCDKEGEFELRKKPSY